MEVVVKLIRLIQLFGLTQIGFPEVYVGPGRLSRSGKLIGAISTTLVPISLHGADLRPKRSKWSWRKTQRLLQCEHVYVCIYNVCMYGRSYRYVSMYVHTCTFICNTCVCTYVRACIHTYVHTYTQYVHTYTYIRTHARMYVHACLPTSLRAGARACIHAHIHMYMHAGTYIPTFIRT